MHATLELEDKDFDKLVQFVSTETLQTELRKRVAVAVPVEYPKQKEQSTAATAAIPVQEKEPPEAPKRKPGRPKLVKEESREIDFGAENGAEEPDAKVYSREDVVTALNAYANNGGGLAAGKAKIKEFCGTEKLADIPVDRYGEFIKSLEAQ